MLSCIELGPSFSCFSLRNFRLTLSCSKVVVPLFSAQTGVLLKYRDEKAQLQKHFAAALRAHKRGRYERGMQYVRTHMELFCSLVKTNDHAEFSSHSAPMKKTIASTVPEIADGSSATLQLCVLDFGHAPNFEEIKKRVSQAADQCNYSGNIALLVFYPVENKGQTSSAYLNCCRSLEDGLLKAGLNISSEISIHYRVIDQCTDGSVIDDDPQYSDLDVRRQFAKARLCVSEKLSKSSPWLQSDVLNRAGFKISDCPLRRVKDLRTTERLTGPVEDKLTPAQRFSQRGPEAAVYTLSKLFGGLSLDRSSHVHIQDYGVNAGCFAVGVFDLFMLWFRKADPKAPLVSYSGMVSAADDKTATLELNRLQSRIESMVLTKQWDSLPEAGPREIRSNADIPKPSLKLLSWGAAERPQIPDVVVARFSGVKRSADWAGKCSELTTWLEETFTDSTPAIFGGGPRPTLTGKGPELTADLGKSRLTELKKKITMEECKAVDFNTAQVTLGID